MVVEEVAGARDMQTSEGSTAKGSFGLWLLQELASERQALHTRHSSSQQQLETARRETATLQRQLQLAEVESAAPDPATLGSLQLQGQQSSSSCAHPVRSRASCLRQPLY